jgi:hypothetical protein
MSFLFILLSQILGRTVLFLCISLSWVLLDEGLEDGKNVLM